MNPDESSFLASQPGPSPPRDAMGAESPRILIIRAGAIGDTLMATPLVRAARRTYPKARLVFICSRQAVDLLRYNPHLDCVHPLAYRHWPLWLSPEKLRIRSSLRRIGLDWALALESHRSFIRLAKTSGAERVMAYGAGPDDEGFERATFDPKRHSIENHLQAASVLGVRPDGLQMDLNYPGEMDREVGRRLTLAGVSEEAHLVGIHPGWAGRSHTLDQTRLRSWPLDRFAQLARWLAEGKKAQVVLTGSRQDRAMTNFIAARAGVGCLDWAGQLTLLQLAALIRRLDLYLTVDAGPAHMAAALGTPLVTLWGPGIYEQTRPMEGRGPVRILRHSVPCAPCYGTPLMKSCQDNICMKEITAAEAQEAMGEMWNAKSRQASVNYSGSI
jgi:lipopolysaccharide heptosyltransferase II